MGLAVANTDYYWGERDKVEEERGRIEWQALDSCPTEEAPVVAGVHQGSREWYLNEESSYLHFLEWMS
jgi:hypothetical protein